MFFNLLKRSNAFKLIDFFVSYDVTALVTNVPLDETIRNLAEKTFTDIYLKNVQNLNIKLKYWA